MRRQIIYTPLSQRPMVTRRPVFIPLAQDTPQQQPIGKQILDYLRFGKAITAPVQPIKTEVLVPPETKKFAREIVFTVGGAIVLAVVLYKVL